LESGENMSEEGLVHIGGGTLATQVDSSAFEVDFGQIKKIEPYTLSLDQPMSDKEGVTPGMLRIVETGQLRKEVKIVLIEKPRESRSYELGKYPDAKLLCFSRDMVKPSNRSPDVQALNCAGCRHSKWEKFNKTKDPKDAPGCKITSRIVAIDFDNVYPVQMYVRGKSRSAGLEEGLQQVIQNFVTIKMSKGNVAWTDVALTLTSEKQKGNPNYQLKIKAVHPLTLEERAQLAGIITIVAAQKQQMLQRLADAEADGKQAVVDDEVTQAVAQATTGSASGPVEGEYVKGSVDEV
jgi:hypothetical protein